MTRGMFGRIIDYILLLKECFQFRCTYALADELLRDCTYGERDGTNEGQASNC